MPLTLPALLGTAQAQTKITVGKFLSGSGFHIPSYVAMDQGFYKAEGLDATFVSLTGRALVTAGLAGSADFIPIPSGGAQAALSGAEIRYVVGESLKSHWVIVARPNVNKVEDLRGKTIVSTSGHSSMTSRPTVPAPAMIRQSSNGGMTAAPLRLAISRAIVSLVAAVTPAVTTVAPYASVAATFAATDINRLASRWG